MFGVQAKLLQLSFIFAVCAALYIVLKVKQWRATLPRNEHLIVDAVLVEIVEDDAAGAWASPVGALVVALASAMVLVKMGYTRTGAQSPEPRRHQQFDADALKHVATSAEEPESGLALKEAPRAPKDADQRDKFPGQAAHKLWDAATGVQKTASLSRLSAMRVQFAEPGDRSTGPRPQVAVTDLAKLGVSNVERAMYAARECVSAKCRSMVQEMDKVNGWLTKENAMHFDCSHTLQAEFGKVVSEKPATGFGVLAQPQQVKTISKAERLANWRLEMLSQMRLNIDGQPVATPYGVNVYDAAQHVELRQQLELQLDPSSTFLMSSVPLPSELQERQQYIVERIRTFATQRSLASFSNDRGDAMTWREGYPTDSQLIVHILKLRVEKLKDRVRLAHHLPARSRNQDDHAIMIGSSGEPYFFVKHTLGSVTQNFQTRPGQDSLFEALVFVVAIDTRTERIQSKGDPYASIGAEEVEKFFDIVSDSASAWGGRPRNF